MNSFDLAKKWDYENGFYLTSEKSRIAKLLAHYELYKMIVGLPGHVVECGVYKGASLIRFLTFRDVLEAAGSRKIIGFDVFGKFPLSNNDYDAAFVEEFEMAGGDGIDVESLRAFLKAKGFTNHELIKGNLFDTLPKYIDKNPALKISLLNIDVDTFDATLAVLTALYDKMVYGGVIILDDYSTVAGATKAIDAYFSDKQVTIKKLSINHIPAYIKMS